MIDFDQWIQDVQVQLDNESYRAMHCRFRPAVVSDYEGIVSEMDDDDCAYWQLEAALCMDACLHELSTMTI